jgi:hexosaminidase
MNTLSWDKATVGEELLPLLETLSEEYPLKENSSDGIKLSFSKQAKGLDVEVSGNTALIKYSSLSTAARGIGKVIGGEEMVSEELPFDIFGILIDCSRNATLKVDYFKKYLCRLALMGYNMAMLYTKDAYELPGEDFFGYLRGRYTLGDLQEIDSYASTLGIEMIGSVQALGHLEPTLQWPAYAGIQDTPSVILTSEEKSYKLIKKILEFWSKAFKSRRIHLGMDETHDLGRGRYMDINGYKCGYDIFNNHLKKVSKDCDDLDLKPIIWSDMYFRLGSEHGGYYDENMVIPPDVKNDIPESVQLNYWDYYHDNEEFYRKWIKRHREELGFEPIMASGIWSWPLFWHNHKKTVETAVPCIDACIKEGIKDFFFTVWADDGTFCNLESILAGACSMAEKAFSKSSEMNEDNAQRLFDAVCKSDYAAHKKMSELTVMGSDNIFEGIAARSILWDDPLLQIYRKNQMGGNPDWNLKAIKLYQRIAREIANVPENDEGCFGYGKTLLNILIHKLELMEKLDEAYKGKNIKKLKETAKLVPVIISEIEEFILSFRSYQYDRYNPQGFEIFQIRLGGQKERFREVELRIEEFISGETSSIPELHESASYESVRQHYHCLATASYFV